MSTKQTTQLTHMEDFNPAEQMLFSDPVTGSVPDSKPKIEYRRINISVRNPDGSVGELIIPTTERVFSFGVCKNTEVGSDKITGYTFPLCLWTKDNPTKEEKRWTDGIDRMVEWCIKHLLDNKEDLNLEISETDLTKSKGGLNPLYWKKEMRANENGKQTFQKVQGLGPTLYAKLIYSKKNSKFVTQFYDSNDNMINAFDLIEKPCYVNAAIKIESIFISATDKISLQIKLYEANVELVEGGMKRLLARPNKIMERVEIANSETKSMNDILAVDDERASNAGSLHESETEAPVVQKKPAKKEGVPKRNVKKVAKPSE
jgi:hypothetical protein